MQSDRKQIGDCPRTGTRGEREGVGGTTDGHKDIWGEADMLIVLIVRVISLLKYMQLVGYQLRFNKAVKHK